MFGLAGTGEIAGGGEALMCVLFFKYEIELFLRQLLSKECKEIYMDTGQG